jgi:hypothetical protein
MGVQVYGTEKVPEYNLSSITVPLGLFSGRIVSDLNFISDDQIPRSDQIEAHLSSLTK